MEDLIRRFDSWLSEQRPTYYRCLQPGLSEAEIVRLERELGMILPKPLKTLYRWKDGQRENYEDFLPGGQFMRLSEAIRVHRDRLEDKNWKHEMSDGIWWSEGWFPYLDDGCGGGLCVDLNGDFGGRVGEIVQHHSDIEGGQRYHGSVEIWLATALIAIKEGLLVPDLEYGIGCAGDHPTKYFELLKSNPALKAVNGEYPLER